MRVMMTVAGLGASGIALCLGAYLVIPRVAAKSMTFPVLEM